MTIRDGFKFGIGFVLGKAFMVVLAKGIIKACENGIDALEEKKSNENE